MKGDGFFFGLMIGVLLTALVVLVGALIAANSDNQICLQSGYYGAASTAVASGRYCTKTTGKGEIVIVPLRVGER